MKTSKSYIIYLLTTLLCLSTCKEENNPIPEPEEETCGCNPVTQEQAAHTFILQTDPKLILADRILYKNSIYQLDLSREEVAELQIPEEIYQEFTDYVENLNKE
ncbi:MAG: hypothetical protein LUD15_13250 [Bacteroides sp.]|nr:hypothetical protein [Bacteroides sp.]